MWLLDQELNSDNLKLTWKVVKLTYRKTPNQDVIYLHLIRSYLPNPLSFPKLTFKAHIWHELIGPQLILISYQSMLPY